MQTGQAWYRRWSARAGIQLWLLQLLRRQWKSRDPSLVCAGHRHQRAATPIAAGVAALVKSANPSLSPAQIRTILQRTAQNLGKNGYDALFNFGLVDATAAVAAH